MDVDIVALVADLPQRVALDERLRQRGFTEDTESGVICRWRYQGWIVDVMPPTSGVFGFSNELYPSALAHANRVEIDGVSIPYIDAPHFVGTKLLAFEGRGRDDLQASHDIEDLLAVFNSRPEIAEELRVAPGVFREVIIPRLQALRGKPMFSYVVEGHLANDVPGRAAIVLARIDAILSEA